MKKVIIALAAFLIILGFSIFEIIYTTKAYSELSDFSSALSKQITLCVEHKKRLEKNEQDEDEAALSAYNAAENGIKSLKERWEKRRVFAANFSNHNIIKTIDDRFATLTAQGKVSAWEDAFVTVSALTSYFNGLSDDNNPALSNLL